jgi:tetratricopeptide (TPR) repeat protein
VLSPEQGTLFLLRRAGRLAADATLKQASEQERDQARMLCEELGWLPLALDQAGAYIEETQCGLTDYLQRYQTSRARLLKWRGDLINDHPLPVATTWSLSFQNVEQKNPIAADLLRLCAFLAPDAIPEELITQGAAVLGPVFASIAADSMVLDEAIAALGAYSLLRRDASEKTLSVHRLVQAVLRDEMNEETRQQWATYTIRAVDRSFPDVQNFEERSKCQQWIPHALVCAEFIEEWELVFEEAAGLLNGAAYYLQDRAQYAEDEPLHKRALAINEEMLGETHPNTALSLNSMGLLYYEQGKYAEAEPLYKRALAINENVRGKMHPETATSLSSLGGLYYEQEKYTEAESLFKRALAINEEILGEAHPKTALSLNNLGGFYASQGKYTEAEPLLKRALVIAEHVLGETHSSTRLFRANYADLLRAMNHEDEARALEQKKESS